MSHARVLAVAFPIVVELVSRSLHHARASLGSVSHWHEALERTWRGHVLVSGVLLGISGLGEQLWRLPVWGWLGGWRDGRGHTCESPLDM
eukprot:14979746-Alexandrium_andersonii.AAC.1